MSRWLLPSRWSTVTVALASSGPVAQTAMAAASSATPHQRKPRMPPGTDALAALLRRRSRAASGHRRAGRSPKEHTGQDHSDVGLRVRVSRRGLSLCGTDTGD
jgi:hypothetical protein